jgi:MFS transporter, DHA1 family, multidrug resistance protein
MDLYLPALPALTRDLGAATSMAQLTVTACLIGLALGQLVAGPLSDRLGRSAPLYAGVAAYVAASLLCAVSPSVELLIVARLVQGMAGGVGIVIAQAAGRDLYSGGALIRYYGRLTVLAGLAAIIGPLVGGQLATVTDWRGMFVFLAAIGAVILSGIALVYRETLPSPLRTSGGFGETGRDFRTLLSDHRFTGVVLVQGFVYAALFAYLAGATYVLQGSYGLTPQQYALAFGLNSAGFMVFGYLGGRTSQRWSVTGTLIAGLAMVAFGAFGILAAGAISLPLLAVIVSLLVLVSGVAVTTPPATTLALADYPQLAGTASSLLGMARFGFGGVSAPFVGIAGGAAMLPFGIVTVVSVALAVAAYLTLMTGRTAQPSEMTATPEPEPELVGSGTH